MDGAEVYLEQHLDQADRAYAELELCGCGETMAVHSNGHCPDGSLRLEGDCRHTAEDAYMLADSLRRRIDGLYRLLGMGLRWDRLSQASVAQLTASLRNANAELVELDELLTQLVSIKA